ncbi:phosphatidate cytidylyltransferase [Marivirga atlantica]|jgi:phosphatidate cytidylyltransferase|uniref:Phosphatidate cytidylyltransferase n=1 Tax=Marivirga atlantica TaxID=1548457 RepID=A0A937A511_9BACT|nr:phosphatidate cytidylyltransferase [Marivirga atlantica]MBL0763732.1 phosphatidate cytidylyltransferase [Marivirga atlantica]
MTSRLDKYSNLTQRIIAAIIGVALILFCIVYSQWTYFAVFFVLCMLTQLEFYKLVGLDGALPLKFWGTITGLSVYTITFLVRAQHLDPRIYFAIAPIGATVYFVKLYKKNDTKPFTNIAYTFLGIIYVAIPFSLLHIAVFYNGTYSFQIILGALFILWASDTGAYFAGVRFGRTKLFERISPKKTWEGALGGTILAFCLAALMAHNFDEIADWQWFCIAGIIVIAGTYGDLVESLFKRSIDIKDSGSIIPGHGGFLDRFDGLLLSAPFISAFLMLFD